MNNVNLNKMRLKRLKNNGIPELKLNQLQLAMKKQIEKNIQENKYVFEKTNCPICEKDNSEKLGEKDRYGLYYSTVICKDCGLIYTNPRMTQSSYNQFYNEEYRKLYGGTEKANEEFFSRQQVKGKRIYNFITSNSLISTKDLFVMEVGCGAGGILYYFRSKGSIIKGIDLGEEYINYGREKYNLDLETGTLGNLLLKRKPDLIIYSHVMEHILDIENELKLIRKYSHNNTIIYIEVPGVKEIHKNYMMNFLLYFQNAHVYHFTLTTLINLMSKNGFTFLNGNEFLMSAFKLNELESKNNFINDYNSAISYIDRIEKRRKLYPFTSIGIKRNSLNIILQVVDFLGLRKFLRTLKTILLNLLH